MILAVDVYYKEDSAKVVGLLFDPGDETIKAFKVAYVNDIEDYIPENSTKESYHVF